MQQRSPSFTPMGGNRKPVWAATVGEMVQQLRAPLPGSHGPKQNGGVVRANVLGGECGSLEGAVANPDASEGPPHNAWLCREAVCVLPPPAAGLLAGAVVNRACVLACTRSRHRSEPGVVCPH